MLTLQFQLEQLKTFTFHSGTILIEEGLQILQAFNDFTFHSGAILIRA